MRPVRYFPVLGNAFLGIGKTFSQYRENPNLPLRKVVSGARLVVTGCLADAAVAEELCHEPLLFGRDVQLAVAIAVVLRPGAEDAVERVAYGHLRLVRRVGHELRHATGNHYGFGTGKEAAVAVLACTRQHDAVLGEVGRCQLSYAMAQAGVGERTVTLETDGPAGGCKRVA